MKTTAHPIDPQTGQQAAFAVADGGTWYIPLLVQEATRDSVKVINKLGTECDLHQGGKGSWLHIPDEATVMPCHFVYP